MQNFDEATTRVTKAARDGLRQVKARARRHDRVGEATYRALELTSGGLGAAARALRQLGEAMEPPARTLPARRSARGDAASQPAGRKTA